MNYPEEVNNDEKNLSLKDISTEDILIRESAEDLLKRSEHKEAENLSEEFLESAVEALLFANGEPLHIEKISDILAIDNIKAQKLLEMLTNKYNGDTNRGIFIRKLKDSYTFSTKPEMKNIMQKLFLPRTRPPMTQATYETLAIIAYNQPVTRSQVESVRGVGSDSIISRLVEKGLINECGTLDAPGRPGLFETTELFLKEFGLSSVNDLPPMDMMMYGTLREIENAIADSSELGKDNQITIEQIVEAFTPGKNITGGNLNTEKSPEEIDPDEIVNISGAIFGSGEESADDD